MLLVYEVLPVIFNHFAPLLQGIDYNFSPIIAMLQAPYIYTGPAVHLILPRYLDMRFHSCYQGKTQRPALWVEIKRLLPCTLQRCP